MVPSPYGSKQTYFAACRSTIRTIARFKFKSEIYSYFVDGPVALESIVPHVTYYLDPDWELTVDDILSTGGDVLSPLESSLIGFGYTKSKIWLSFNVENTSGDEINWFLHFRENFLQEFNVYVAREDKPVENILSLARDSPFSERPVPYPELVAPLHLADREQATVLISYWSEGYSGLEVSIETGSSFAEISSKRTAKNYIYCGMMIILIFAAAIFMVVMREVVFVAYLAYALSTPLRILKDGVLDLELERGLSAYVGDIGEVFGKDNTKEMALDPGPMALSL